MARGGSEPLPGRLVGVSSALLLPPLLLLLVVGASAFDSDKLYKYDLEGTVSARVADGERAQLAVVAIQSKLLLRRLGANELLVRLLEPKMANANDLIEDLSAHKFHYQPIESASSLDKPFRIYYDQGAVKSFDTYKDEAKWVSNFKRGLLAFFQLKLSGPQAKEGESADQPPSNQYYSTSEKSVFGECETDYLVMSLPDARLNVTKSRNMAKCKTKFLHNFMPIDASECVESDKELEQYKHSNAIFNFHLSGSPSAHVLHQATLDEVSTFSPFNQRARSHQVQTRAKLSLSAVEGSPDSLAVDEGATRIDSLSYDPPEMVNFYANVNLDDAHHLANIYQTSASVEQVLAAMELLVQEQKSYTGAFESANSSELERSRLAELFLRLGELLGTLSSAKIEQLYSQADERGEAYKKVFWDIMSVAGTNPSLVFMKKLITEGDAPSVKIKDFLTRVSFHIKMPSKSLFDEYVNLCKSDKIQANQEYKRLCSLPLASLIHQHCAKPHAKYLRMQHEGANATAYKKAQNTCQIATAEEYFSRLVSPIPGAGAGSSSPDELSIGDRMFNIKMAGELGVRPSIDYLMEVVRNRDEHPSVRSAAMWNLNKVARIYPAHVKRLVVPFYYDPSELLELRIAAFYNWFYSGISLHEMETLASQLAREPSRQLVLYVHSLMKSLAKLKAYPCSNGIDKSARLVLANIQRALKHQSPGRFDSTVSMSNSWLPDFGYGSAKMMSVIFSNESLAPSNVYYATSEIMSAVRLTPMSVSIQAHGLDKLIKRVIGINGLLADKESFMDVFSLKRRSKRQANSELIKQETAEIDRELKLATRDFSDIYLSVTVSAYGRPITFYEKESRELKKMLSDDGTIKVPQIKKLLHSLNNHVSHQMMIAFEKLEVFNNELGLPLYRSIQDFDYKTFKLASVKLDVEPGFFKDERQGKPPSRFGAAFEAKLARHNEMLIATGALLANSRQLVGAGFHKRKLLQLPIRLAVDANLTENKWALKVQPVSDNLLYVKQQPVTFVKSYSPESVLARDDSPVAHWRPLYDLADERQMKAFNLSYMTPLALGLRLEGKHRVGSDWSLAGWRRFLAQNGADGSKFLYFYSPTAEPLEMRLSATTTGAGDNPTRELALQLSWRHHHSAGEDPLNEFERELESQTSKSTDNGKPTTVSYRLALVGGSAAERLLALDINYSRSSDRLQHRWRAAYQRTPLEASNAAADVTNLCWLGSLEFPKHNVSRLLNLEPSLLDMDSSVRMTSELTFGDHCSADRADSAPAKVTGRAKFSWSAEQREQVQLALARGPLEGHAHAQAHSHAHSHSDGDYHTEQAQHRELLLELAHLCAERRQRSGAQLDGACLELLQRITELTQVEAEFEYRNVPERWVRLVKRAGSLYTYARAGYIAEMDERAPLGRELKSADGRNERAYLSANMSSVSSLASERQLSYQLDTPNYHVAYRNLPFALPPPSTFPLLDSSYYGRLQNEAAARMCSVSGQTVTTFDQLTYQMPPVGDGCFKLITKDCSPEANFVVLGAKVGPAKVVKVYIAQRFKVEFVPDKDARRVGEVKVNGETVQLEPNGAPVIRDTKLGARSVEAFRVENNGAFYTLSSKFYKFAVSTDGTWIVVQQSNYYAGKSCGICGDSNGDQLFELESPSSAKRTCKSTDDFVWSYVLPSTCASRPSSVECA